MGRAAHTVSAQPCTHLNRQSTPEHVKVSPSISPYSQTLPPSRTAPPRDWLRAPPTLSITAAAPLPPVMAFTRAATSSVPLHTTSSHLRQATQAAPAGVCAHVCVQVLCWPRCVLCAEADVSSLAQCSLRVAADNEAPCGWQARLSTGWSTASWHPSSAALHCRLNLATHPHRCPVCRFGDVQSHALLRATLC